MSAGRFQNPDVPVFYHHALRGSNGFRTSRHHSCSRAGRNVVLLTEAGGHAATGRHRPAGLILLLTAQRSGGTQQSPSPCRPNTIPYHPTLRGHASHVNRVAIALQV
ncbi:hypothetical protein K438DRAFT_1173526 [Mycena galopus ATCC 62051]|nr:hypothetical protein K438DRAFT_1173526 [Mycena galopus ATCC 62051]